MSPRRPCIALLALISGACFAGSPADTLYARLGGSSKIAAIVDQTIERAAADPRTQQAFAHADLARVKDSWIARICAISGGGCRAADEATPGISAGAIEELRRAMRAQDVPLAARNELLELLAAVSQTVASP